MSVSVCTSENDAARDEHPGGHEIDVVTRPSAIRRDHEAQKILAGSSNWLARLCVMRRDLDRLLAAEHEGAFLSFFSYLTSPRSTARSRATVSQVYTNNSQRGRALARGWRWSQLSPARIIRLPQSSRRAHGFLRNPAAEIVHELGFLMQLGERARPRSPCSAGRAQAPVSWCSTARPAL